MDLLLLAKTAPGADDAYARLKAAPPAASLMSVAAQAGFGSAIESSGSPHRRSRLNGERLRALISAGRATEAAAWLEKIDLDAEAGADFQYYAGVCLSRTEQPERAITLLKRAAAGGFLPFWCTYMLGVCEIKLRHPLSAAYYYTVALVLKPDRSQIYSMLEKVVPDVDPAALRAAQAGIAPREQARTAFDRGIEALQQRNDSRAAFCFTIAVVLDPEYVEAKTRLLELAPDISFSVLPLPTGPGSADRRSLR